MLQLLRDTAFSKCIVTWDHGYKENVFLYVLVIIIILFSQRVLTGQGLLSSQVIIFGGRGRGRGLFLLMRKQSQAALPVNLSGWRSDVCLQGVTHQLCLVGAVVAPR